MKTAADLKPGDVFADDVGEHACIFQLHELSPGAANVLVIRAPFYQGRMLRVSLATQVAEVLEHVPLGEEQYQIDTFQLSCVEDFERMIAYL
jgi:hypothetical protein